VTANLILLIRRIPWRVLVTILAGVVVVKGACLLSMDLPANSAELAQVVKQGMGMVVVGGVVLIGVVIS